MEHALWAILADFLFGGDQGLKFGDLHRLVRLRATTTACLNLGKDLLVSDSLQSGLDRHSSALITKLIKILDVLRIRQSNTSDSGTWRFAAAKHDGTAGAGLSEQPVN